MNQVVLTSILIFWLCYGEIRANPVKYSKHGYFEKPQLIMKRGYEESCDGDDDLPEDCSDDDVNKEYDFDPDGSGEIAVSILSPLKALKIKELADQASAEAAKCFPNSLTNGKGDAFRHALWQYLITIEYGAEVAKEFGDAHEVSNPNKKCVRAMDLHNNRGGRCLASDPANAGKDPVTVVKDAVNSGKLQVQPSGKCRDDPHYTTFDGAKFDFQGNCSYMLSKECNDNPWFMVEVKQLQEGQRHGRPFTRVSMVTVHILQQHIQLHRNGKTLVNGVVVPDERTIMEIRDLDRTITIERLHGFHMIIDVEPGLVVLWDGLKVVDVQVSHTMSGKVCGLLGDADGNPKNDFMKPSGELTDDPIDFGNSWVIQNSCDY